MPVSREVRAGWERRLPELSAPWTHWRITGDGRPIADVVGDDLFGALRLVQENFGRFISIKANRICVDDTGKCVKADIAVHEISRHAYDSIRWDRP
jgi:hypothetical protein